MIKGLVAEAAGRTGAAIWKLTFPGSEVPPLERLIELGRKLDHIHSRYAAISLTTDRARIDRALRQLRAIRKSAGELRRFAEEVNDQSDELAAALFRRTAPEPAKLQTELFEQLETFAKRQIHEHAAIERTAGDSDNGPVSAQERLIISLAAAFEKLGLGVASIVNWNSETRAEPRGFQSFVSAFCKTMQEPPPSRSTIEKALSKRKLPNASLEAQFMVSLSREAARGS